MIVKHSPNYNARPVGFAIDTIVIHADAGRTEAGTIAWCLNPQSRVSYHYLVARHGTVYQLVADAHRAWHAGVSQFDGRANVNDFSIGVAFANDQRGEPFPPAQIDAGVILVADLCAYHGIPPERVTTHAAIAPGRKHDPGERFPWSDFMARVRAQLAAIPQADGN